MMQFRSLAMASIAALAVSGCVGSSAIAPPSADGLPARYLADGPAAQPDDAWWKRFDDPRLDALIAEAVSQSPRIGQALAQTEQARAQARVQTAQQLPQVNGSFTAARARQNLGTLGPIADLAGGAAGADVPTSFTTDNFEMKAEISWQADLFGTLRAQSAAARADLLASEAGLRATRQAVAAETARLYFQLIEARAQAQVSRKVVETFGEIARQVGNRADVGIAPPNDKLLAISNLESARAGLEQREEAVKRLTRGLETLLRDYPAGTLAVPDTLPRVPAAPPAGLPADLLERRPDIVAARYQVAAAGYRNISAKRSLLPSINLTGSAGTASSDLSDLTNGDFLIWSIAGSILQPIFQGGRLRAQVRLTSGQRAEALESYVETVLTALSEVETALAVDEQLARSEAAYEASAEAAEKSVSVSFNRYRAGIDPFVTVLQSQQRALDNRFAVLGARRARLENRIDLHLALGGGFGPANPAPEFIGSGLPEPAEQEQPQ